MKESFNQYLEYADSDDELTYKVRMERKWDDASYTTCIKLVMAAINEYKETDLVPIPVVMFFTSGIPYLMGIISHPDFSPAQKELVDLRREELLSLQAKFFSGELFMKDQI
jgi:hypothetical protein